MPQQNVLGPLAGFRLRGTVAQTARTASAPPPYASFWARFAAFSLDAILVVLLQILTVSMLAQVGAPDHAFTAIMILIPWLYYAGMEAGPWGATLGKRIAGIRIADPNFKPASFLKTSVRFWAHLLSVITLFIGFVMGGFTARKQCLHDMVAGTVVVSTGPGRVWTVTLVALAMTVVVGGGMGTYFTLVTWPKIEGYVNDAVAMITESDTLSKVAPLEIRVPEPILGPQDLSNADYNRYLQAHPGGLDSGTFAHAGPVVMHLADFWDDPQEPHVWLRVNLPPIPNMHLGERLATVSVTHVYDVNGTDRYDRRNRFELPMFHSTTLSASSFPQPHLSGIRDVRLLAGTGESDVSRVEGSIILAMPLGLMTTDIGPEQVGEPVDGNDVVVEITEMSGNQLLMKYWGQGHQLISVDAYNAAGEKLALSMGYTPAADDIYEGQSVFKRIYSGDIARVQFTTAREFTIREYPFVLSR